MFGKVRDYIEKHDMLAENDKVVIGVSGGADSVALLLIVKELAAHFGIEPFAVHINHCLRGEEADRDEAFTTDLCKRIGVPLEIYREDVAAISEKEGISTEEAGRRVRYKAFEDAAGRIGANKIAVAHHMDDNAETVIFRIARGTGIKGLAGMHPKRELAPGLTLIRPLLEISRSEIEEWLEERGQAYCTDSTNLEEEYSRNLIRNRVIPTLEDINTNAAYNISALAAAAAETEEYLVRASEREYGNLVEFGRTRNTMLVRIPKNPEPVLFERILRSTLFKVAKHEKDITSTHIKLIAELAEKQTGSRLSLPYGVTAEKSYDCIVFKRETDEPPLFSPKIEEEILPREKLEAGPVLASVPGVGDFEFELIKNTDCSFSKEDYTKFFDYDKINDNPVLRIAREGDTIAISPEGGRKSVKKLYSDLKVQKDDRDAIPVIAEGSNILWIPGIRTGENRRVDETTVNILRITWRKE